MKTREFETKIEVSGVALDALIRYECDPEDGWPLIEAVSISKTLTVLYDQDGRFLSPARKERVSLDITKLLDEYQMHAFASEIHDALNADRNSARIEKMELWRLERAAA